MKRFVSIVILSFLTLLCLNARSVRIAFVGDPQVNDVKELDYARRSIYKELRERKDLDLVIILGDLVNDKPDLLQPSIASLDSLPCPWICVPGNHDRNVYRDGRARDLSSFVSLAGYCDTSFVLGNVRFVCMNNVMTRNKADYEGRLSAEQKIWLKEKIVNNNDEKALVLCTHIPISQSEDRDSIYSILGSESKVLLCSGHLHSVARSITPAGEEIIAGAACGAWWRGVKDSCGIPYALQNCGAPRGYFVADFNCNSKHWYKMQYKCVGRNDIVSAYKMEDGALLVNVYGGAQYAEVNVRAKGKTFVAQVAHRPTVEVMKIIEWNKTKDRTYRKAHKDEFIPMRRLKSPHLWQIDSLPDNCRKVRIKYEDNSMKFKKFLDVKAYDMD